MYWSESRETNRNSIAFEQWVLWLAPEGEFSQGKVNISPWFCQLNTHIVTRNILKKKLTIFTKHLQFELNTADIYFLFLTYSECRASVYCWSSPFAGQACATFFKRNIQILDFKCSLKLFSLLRTEIWLSLPMASPQCWAWLSWVPMAAHLKCSPPRWATHCKVDK